MPFWPKTPRAAVNKTKTVKTAFLILPFLVFQYTGKITVKSTFHRVFPQERRCPMATEKLRHSDSADKFPVRGKK